MPGPSPLRMNDIIREDQKKKQQDFLRKTEEFPCLFNIGTCKLGIGSTEYTGIALCELDVPENVWKFLKDDLNNDSEVILYDKEDWNDNLLTYVYAELGNYDDASKLNRKIQDQHGKSNLVTLVNAAFLLFRENKLCEACRILDDLKKLKSQQSFADLKIDAICELGYAFHMLADAKNIQFSISFLEFALLFRPHDEKIQLMLAIVYRRCCHFNIYSADPENINRHDFALKAAKSLFKLGTTSKNASFKAAALIELAYLKFDDEPCNGGNYNRKHSLLSPEEWFQIVQDRTSKQFCDEAIEACENGPSEKVLKMAGQLYRYYGKDDCLEKSEQLLTRAIAKRPSNRAHHQLGLTYRKMAVRHEQKYNMSQNNTIKMRQASRGYHQQSLNYRRELNTHQKNSQQHTHYVSDKHVRNDYYNKHTNRGHHRQGFTSQTDHKKHDIFENGTEGACGHKFQVLPKPPVNCTPQTPEKRLKCIVKVPDQFKSFSKDNPHIGKAIDHLQQAVDISCCQNKVAVYDLACILVQAENYEKSKEICKILIAECTSSDTTSYPVHLVNAYNLYGICCAKEAEAEVNQVNKKRLVAESEENLTLAVTLASYLAATVPELEMCATDLWKAFGMLEKKFKGQQDSREKLYRRCEHISDYRYLEAVDRIVSQDPAELKKMEVIEQCLKRYLNMKAYDSALRFLIILQPEVKAKLPESKFYKQLMLKVAEGKLEKMFLERNTEACHADPSWKQLFNDEIIVTGSSKKYDIVIVSDFNDDYELKIGMMCDISKHLKRVLLETFGLSVVHAHEKTYPGCIYLEKLLQIIQNSRVSLFVLTHPCIDSLSLESEVAGLRISEREHYVPESAAINEESNDSCTPEGPPTSSQCANQNSVSRMYERIIIVSMCNFLNNIGATRLVLVIPDSLKLEDLPQAVRGLPNITLSPSEIEILTATVPGSNNEQCINLMKKIFRAVHGNLPE